MVDLSPTPPTPAAAKANVAALQQTFASGQSREAYDPTTGLDDLPLVREALQLFLESKMVESEDLINNKDPIKCVVKLLHRCVNLTCLTGRDCTVLPAMALYNSLKVS